MTDVNPRLTRFEASCFDGVYVTGDVTPGYLDHIELARLSAQGGVEEDVPKSQMNLQFSVATD